jgi:hypothetical protein
VFVNGVFETIGDTPDVLVVTLIPPRTRVLLKFAETPDDPELITIQPVLPADDA